MYVKTQVNMIQWTYGNLQIMNSKTKQVSKQYLLYKDNLITLCNQFSKLEIAFVVNNYDKIMTE